MNIPLKGCDSESQNKPAKGSKHIDLDTVKPSGSRFVFLIRELTTFATGKITDLKKSA